MRIIYNSADVSNALASHDNSKHFINDGPKWAKHGIHIKSHENFRDHIEKVLNDKDTEVFKLSDYQDIYYSDKYKTTAIVNLAEKEFGTCYYSRNRNSFRNKIDSIRRERYLNSSMQHPLLKGGRKALFDQKEIDRKKVVFKDNFNGYQGLKTRKHRIKNQFEKVYQLKEDKAKDQKKHEQRLTERRIRAHIAKQKQLEAQKYKERELKRNKDAQIQAEAKKAVRKAELEKQNEISRQKEREKREMQKSELEKQRERIRQQQMRKAEQAKKSELDIQRERIRQQQKEQEKKSDLERQRERIRQQQVEEEAERQRRREKEFKANEKEITKGLYR